MTTKATTKPERQVSRYRLRSSFLACPSLRGRFADFFDGGNFLRSTREQADKARYCPNGLWRLEHAPAIWQQVQLDLVAWPDTEVLQYVLAKRYLSPCSNGQCDHGDVPSQFCKLPPCMAMQKHLTVSGKWQRNDVDAISADSKVFRPAGRRITPCWHVIRLTDQEGQNPHPTYNDLFWRL